MRLRLRKPPRVIDRLRKCGWRKLRSNRSASYRHRMTLRLSAALLFLSGVGVLGLLAVMNQFAIVDAVNAKLPPESQFNSIGWSLPKTERLYNQYRRLNPRGGLLRRQGILTTAMLFCIAVAAGLIGLNIFLVAWPCAIGSLAIWYTYFRGTSRN